MFKIAASWTLVVGGVLLSTTALGFLVALVYDKIKWRLIGPAILPESSIVPELVGIEPRFLRVSLWTTPWVFAIGLLGISLLIIAAGLHLRHLYFQETGIQKTMGSHLKGVLPKSHFF
jgi:hypothetical protein